MAFRLELQYQFFLGLQLANPPCGFWTYLFHNCLNQFLKINHTHTHTHTHTHRENLSVLFLGRNIKQRGKETIQTSSQVAVSSHGITNPRERADVVCISG